jgi:ABC-type dipeptide/oligopeptide/nickel transport system ATPase component
MITIGIFMAPGYYRLTRSSTLSVRNEPYTDAARVAGLSNPRIIARHILVVISAPIIIQTALSAGVSMGMQAGLQFLGIGDASIPSWGAMMNSAFQNMSTNQFLLLPPALALGLTIAVLAMMGSALAETAGTRAQPVVRVRRRAKTGRDVTVQGFAATPPMASPAAPPAAPPTTPPESPLAASPSNDVAVRISGLRVRYGEDPSKTEPPHGTGSEVLHGIGLDVGRGEVLGIVGESGSGKSQTVFALLDLLPAGGRATADELWFDGKNLLSMSPRDRRRLLGTRIGYIPQEPMTNLDPSFTIGYQLCEPMRRVLSMSRAQARQHAAALLDRVGIEDPARVMKAYPHEISGGMAQRVLIAGAIAGRPSLLVADEPTTALDVTVQAEVLELLRELQEADGMTLIIVTHNFGVVADICDRVAVMKHGDVIEVGDVETIFAAASDPYTAELIGASLDESESRRELDSIARGSARSAAQSAARSGADRSATQRIEEPVR